MAMELENRVLDKLIGKIHLLQEKEDREKVVLDSVSQAYLELKKRPPEELPNLDQRRAKEEFVSEFLSYGLIEDFMNDPDIEDITINSLNPIFVRHNKRGIVKTDKGFRSWEELEFFVRKLVVFSGKTKVAEIHDLTLPDIRSRVNIVCSPFGPQVTISRIRQKPWSIIKLIEVGTLSYRLAAQLWMYIDGLSVRPANILIAGGIGAGKTTLLNALFSFLPMNDRVVVIEDTIELNTRTEENCARLESTGSLSMKDLVKNSLRMRPDRVIVGEVRGAEASDMMTAMNIGKVCMGTIHASTAREAVIRLENEPMNIPTGMIPLVDVFIVMRRFNIRGEIFRVVGEVVEIAGIEQKKVLLAELWAYDLASHRIEEKAPSSIYRDRLAGVAGVRPSEIMDEIRVRAGLLWTLAQRDIKTIEEISSFCKAYSINSKELLDRLGCRREKLYSMKTPS